MTLEGIDVSVWQGQINWRLVKQQGMTFAFIKATEGLYGTDPWFYRNWSEARKNRFVMGAYHFLRPSYDGSAQAHFHHQYVRDNGHFNVGDFDILDLEVTDNMSTHTIVKCAEDYVVRSWHEIDKTVIIYTGPSFWNDTLGEPKSEILGQCPLWLADWSPTIPTLNNWPHGASFHQYSATGLIPGVTGNVDRDRFYGSMEQLHKLQHRSH